MVSELKMDVVMRMHYFLRQNSHLVLFGVVGSTRFFVERLEDCHGLATRVGDEVGTSSPAGGKLGRMPTLQPLPSRLEPVKLRGNTS